VGRVLQGGPSRGHPRRGAQHAVDGQNIPFLSNFIDQYTGGNLFTTDLFFVKRTPFPKRFGGSLGNMIDPMTNIRLRARCHGELLLRVENPEALIYQYFGMRKYQEHADIFDWFINSFFNTVKSTVGKLAREQRRTSSTSWTCTTSSPPRASPTPRSSPRPASGW
jgi:membrane protease subunit (stomatin/prohibitin family)